MKTLAVTFTTAAAATIALLAPALAHADGGIYQCAPNAPGGVVLTCIPAEGQIAQSQQPYGGGYAPTERTLTGRTHNWLAPTGEMLRAGDAQLNLHEFIYADAAIGVTDNVEINFTTPLVPVFASVGARIGLTSPESPLKLVISGSLYFPLFEDGGEDLTLVQMSGTAAYSTPTMNLHATLSVIGTHQDNDEAGLIVNVGGSYKIGRKTALMFEFARFSEARPDSYSDSLAMSALGIKFIGATTDIDLGLWFPQFSEGGESDDGPAALPMMSMSYKF